jgi:hypothetical protein
MGVFQSSPPSSNTVSDVLLSDLLSAEAEDVDWDRVSQLLIEEPEQACLYLHSVEISPLQVALARSLSPPRDPPIVSLFVEAYEDALLHMDHEGNTVLHSCVDSAANWHANLEILLKHNNHNNNACGELASRRNKDGQLPLHRNVRDAEAAKSLITAYPQGMRQRDVKDRVPLHYALLSQEQQENGTGNTGTGVIVPEVVRVMAIALDGNKTTITMRDKRGISPLALLPRKLDTCFNDGDAANSELSEEGLELWQQFLDLIRILPSKQISTTTSEQSEPELHKIVDISACPLRAVLHAIGTFPEQASVRNSLGRTPLHVAPVRTSHGSVISKLLTLFPPGARMTDREGRLAIDLAIGGRAGQGLGGSRGGPRSTVAFIFNVICFTAGPITRDLSVGLPKTQNLRHPPELAGWRSVIHYQV